ncbi:MAG: hypothetical protein K6T31_06345, partial [Alicyclobacillus sp.]|nr:hypothetical protein [Alicyclobacillus sp.]
VVRRGRADIAVRLVDVGGVTPLGKAVRQFTLPCDRAAYGLGERRADPAYDVFALAVSVLQTAGRLPLPRGFTEQTPVQRSLWLERAVHLYPYAAVRPILTKALAGELDALTFASAWQQAHARVSAGRPVWVSGTASQQAGQRRGSGGRSQGHARIHGGIGSYVQARGQGRRGTAGVQATMPRRAARDWTEWVMWTALALAATVAVGAWVIALSPV